MIVYIILMIDRLRNWSSKDKMRLTLGLFLLANGSAILDEYSIFLPVVLKEKPAYTSPTFTPPPLSTETPGPISTPVLTLPATSK